MTQKEMNELILNNPERRMEAAFHEAAHYVTHIAYCKSLMVFPYVEKISIEAEESTFLGYVRRRSLIVPDLAEIELQIPQTRDGAKKRIHMEIKFVLAGLAAEFTFSIYHKHNETEFFFDEIWFNQEEGTDVENAKLYYTILHGQTEDDILEVKMYEIFLDVLKDVRKYWPLIESVGNQLNKTLVIEGEELEKLTWEIYESIDGDL